MLKTMSGRSSRRRSGKSGVASRRITVPYAESAEATASIVVAESHSANASSILGGLSSERGSDTAPIKLSALSGFWLYANPMRVIQSLCVVRFLLHQRSLDRSREVRRVHCDERAQNRCQPSSMRKIRKEKSLGNDFFCRDGDFVAVITREYAVCCAS